MTTRLELITARNTYIKVNVSKPYPSINDVHRAVLMLDGVNMRPFYNEYQGFIDFKSNPDVSVNQSIQDLEDNLNSLRFERKLGWSK